LKFRRGRSLAKSCGRGLFPFFQRLRSAIVWESVQESLSRSITRRHLHKTYLLCAWFIVWLLICSNTDIAPSQSSRFSMHALRSKFRRNIPRPMLLFITPVPPIWVRRTKSKQNLYLFHAITPRTTNQLMRLWCAIQPQLNIAIIASYRNDRRLVVRYCMGRAQTLAALWWYSIVHCLSMLAFLTSATPHAQLRNSVTHTHKPEMEHLRNSFGHRDASTASLSEQRGVDTLHQSPDSSYKPYAHSKKKNPENTNGDIWNIGSKAPAHIVGLYTFGMSIFNINTQLCLIQLLWSLLLSISRCITN